MDYYYKNRRNQLLSIITTPFKSIIKAFISLLMLPVDILTHMLEPLVLSSRALAKKYNGISPDDKSGQNHKHDNYQSQIDTINRRVEDLAQALSNRIDRNYQEINKLNSRLSNYVKVLDDKFEGAAFCFEENKKDINELQLSIESISDKLNSHIDLVDARQINLNDMHQLDLLEGEAMYHDAVREADYVREADPDFHFEQKAMAKQIAKIAERDKA